MALLETQFTWTCTYIPVPVTFPSGPISTENHRLCPLFKIITTKHFFFQIFLIILLIITLKNTIQYLSFN